LLIFEDPKGTAMEVFKRDAFNPQKPKVWAKDPSASNLWGIMPTDEMHK
jgi:hypothetical protein